MKLAKREKLFIYTAAGVIGTVFILYMLVFPFFEKKNKLARETEALESIINDMNRLGISGQDIGKMSGGLERVLARRREPLYSLIDKEAMAAGLKPKTTKQSEGKERDGYIEDYFTVDLQEITMTQLTDFLYRIEKPEEFIFINSFKLSKNKKKEGFFDSNIRIMSYKKVNPEQ